MVLGLDLFFPKSSFGQQFKEIKLSAGRGIGFESQAVMYPRALLWWFGFEP